MLMAKIPASHMFSLRNQALAPRRSARRLRSSTAIWMPLAATWGLILAAGPLLAGDQTVSVPLDYSYETTDKGESYVSRITIWVSTNDGKPQKLTFDTGSDKPNMQIDPKVTGVEVSAGSRPVLYSYGAGTYGYKLQSVTVGDVTYRDPSDPENDAKALRLPLIGRSGYGLARIDDIVYTTSHPGADKMELSKTPVIYGVDASGNQVPFYADLQARALIEQGKAADEGGTVWGTFGASSFLFKGGAGTGLIGGATTSGYIVAANGNSGVDTHGQTPGCSPCLIVNLDPALRAQFVSFMPWGEKTADDLKNYEDGFAGSGAHASTLFEGAYTLGFFAGAGKDAVPQTKVAALLDTGTPGGGMIYISQARLQALIDSGVVVNKAQDGSLSLPQLTILAPDGQEVALSSIDISLIDGTAATPVTFIAGQDFFLSESVMYDLENRTTAYTPYFVSADDFTTDTPGKGEVQLTRITADMGSAFPEDDGQGNETTTGYFGAAGVISGEGSLTVAKNAVLRLTNTNTYTGETLIEQGATVELAGIGSIEASSRVVADGLLDIADKGNRTVAWGVPDAYNDARIRSLAGAGTVQLADRQLILTAADDTFSGAITDLDDDKKHAGGRLAILGGIQTLGGASTFAGATTVGPRAGLVLAATGSLASPVSVAGLFANHGVAAGVTTVTSGGTATGTGTFGALTVETGGTVAPGGAAPLHVAGDFVQQAGATYLFGPAANGARTGIAIGGAATIEDGARLELTRAAAGDVTIGRHVLLTADGGIAGGYERLTGDLVTDAPFLAFALDSGTRGLTLDVERSTVAFAAVGATANQRASGAGLESLGAGNVLHDDALTMTGAQARAAFDTLSGEIHASMQGALVEESHFLRDAAVGRLRAAFGTVGAMLAPVQTPGVTRMESAPATTDLPATWGQAFGAWGHADGDGNAARLDRRTGGFLLGADASVEDWRLGGLIGFSDSSYDLDDRYSSGSSRNYHIGAYAGAQWGAAGLRSGLAYSWHRIETDRSNGTLSDPVSARYDGHTFQAFGEYGYRIDIPGGTAVEPYAGLAHVRLKTDGFGESGGGAALDGAEGAMNTTFTTLGLRTATIWQLGSADLAVSGGISWRHAFGDVTPGAAMAFGGGALFDVTGVPIAKNAALADLGVDLAISEASSVRIDYQGQFASKAQEHRLRAIFTMEF